MLVLVLVVAYASKAVVLMCSVAYLFPGVVCGVTYDSND